MGLPYDAVPGCLAVEPIYRTAKARLHAVATEECGHNATAELAEFEAAQQLVKDAFAPVLAYCRTIEVAQ